MNPPNALPKRIIHRTFKYRIYPTKHQVDDLEKQFRACCDLYNAALEQRRWAYRVTGRSPALYDQHKDLTEARQAGVVLPMSAWAQRWTLCRLDEAFKAFFRRCKAGENPGYPRFRSYSRFDSVTWSSGACLKGSSLRIQGVGAIRLRQHREIPADAKIRTITVRRQAGRWYACVSWSASREERTHSGPEIGLDLGVTNFVALSTGEMVPGLRSNSKKRRRLQRRVSRRKLGSNRRRKAVRLLALHGQHEANRRRDLAHKVSRRLVDTYGLIAVEKLAVSQMVRSARGPIENPGRNVSQKAGLNRRISEQGWSEFMSFLDYKAEEAGGRVVRVNPRKTSQTCSSCGIIDAKSRETQARFRCTSCGFLINADINAARNILALGLGRSLQAPTVGEEVRAVA